ncbi:MAG: transcriptional repressor LexA [Lachnospirales bacterium]
MKKLTKQQQRVYDYILEAVSGKGIIPSIREMCDSLGFKSTSTVHLHLVSLEEKGYIRREKSKNRSIEILDPFFLKKFNEEYVQVPIIGSVAAGDPIFAQENVEDFFPIPVNYVGNHEVFMLRIKGQSMIDAGIFDGDLVLCSKQNTARNKDIVVALIDDEATCKTFYREKNHIRLQPENESYEPIIAKELSILGIVIGLYRTY